MLMDTVSGSEKLFTGRTRFLENKFFSRASNREEGVGLVQFKPATKPGIKQRNEINSHHVLNAYS